MNPVLWTLASVVAYIGGLIIIVRVTPRLLSHSFDEFAFTGIAALDILGAILMFGAVAVMYALFNAALAIKVLDFFLLIGIILVTLRMSLSSFRPRIVSGTFRLSRILAGSFCLCLTAAAVFYMIQLFRT